MVFPNSGKFPKGNREKPGTPGKHRDPQRMKTLLRITVHLPSPHKTLHFVPPFFSPSVPLPGPTSPLGHSPYIVLPIAIIRPSFLMFCTQVHTRHIILCLSIILLPCFDPHIPPLIHVPHNLLSTVPFTCFSSLLSLTRSLYAILHCPLLKFVLPSSTTSSISTLQAFNL